jgi:hypothetical protein
MPPKKRDLAAEKAAKQKKLLFILIPGFLVVVYFFLLPTLTKGGGGSPAVAAAAPSVTTTPGTVTPATPGTVTPVTPVASGAPGAVAAPSYSFAASDSQLKRFSGNLKSKDPFAGAAGSLPTPTPKTPVVAPTPPSVPGSTTPDSTTPGSTTPAAAPFIYAVVSVNGVAEGVSLNAAFPAAGPLFRLSGIGTGSITFSLVSGSFANRAQSVKLRKGRKVTLRNTADGSRYVLQLIAVSRTTPTTTGTTPTSTSVLVSTDPTAVAPATTSTTTPPPPTTPTG